MLLVEAHKVIDQRHVLATPALERLGDRLRQIEQCRVLGDKGRGFPDGLGNLALLFPVGQLAADVVGNLAGRESVTLQILNDLIGLGIIRVDEARNCHFLGQQGRAIAARAVVDEIAPLHLGVGPNGNRRLHAARPDRLGHFRQRIFVKLLAGLVRVFVNQRQLQFERSARTALRGRRRG